MHTHWVVEYNEPQTDTPSKNWYKWRLVCAGHDSPSTVIMHLAQRLCSKWQDLTIVEENLLKANNKLRRIAMLIDEWALVKNGITKEIIDIIAK